MGSALDMYSEQLAAASLLRYSLGSNERNLFFFVVLGHIRVSFIQKR